MVRSKVLYSAITLCWLLPTASPVAFAAEERAIALEEVVVTARRREESVLEAPVAVTAST